MYVFLSFFCLFVMDHSNFKYGSLKIYITVVLRIIWHTFELYKHYQNQRWHRNTLSSSPNPLTTLKRKKKSPKHRNHPFEMADPIFWGLPLIDWFGGLPLIDWFDWSKYCFCMLDSRMKWWKTTGRKKHIV